MRLRLIFIALAAVAPFLPRGARAEGAHFPVLPTEEIRLANGLRVLLAPDPHAPLASVVVSYGAGSADDPNGKRGLAHLTEHLVFQATKHVASGSRTLENAGATWFNATTYVDTTRYFETVPPERLASVLWLESDRMGFAVDAVTDGAVAAERDVVRNEARDRTLDRTLASVDALTGKELFPAWHPYSVVGVEDADLDRVHAPDVRAFLRTWYGPGNASIAIAGRFDREATLALVRRYFESIPAVPAPERPSLPDWSAPSLELSVDASIPNDAVLLEWRTPAFGEPGDAALDLAATALAGSGNERLSRSLIATHLATAVSAEQVSRAQASWFLVYAVAAPGVTPAVLLHAIQDTINDFARSAAPSEMARAREVWRRESMNRLASPAGRAERLTSAAELHLKVGTTFDWGLARYEALRDEDIRRAVAQSLGLTHRLAIGEFANRHALRRGVVTGREEVTQ